LFFVRLLREGQHTVDFTSREVDLVAARLRVLTFYSNLGGTLGRPMRFDVFHDRDEGRLDAGIRR